MKIIADNVVRGACILYYEQAGSHTSLLKALSFCLRINALGALQTMLNRLAFYECPKHLTVNTAKSKVVHFDLKARC